VVQHNVPRIVSELVTPPDVARINALTRRQIRALSQEQLQSYRDRLTEYYDTVFGRIRAEIDKATRLSRRLEGQGVDLLVWPETTVQEPLNPESTPHLNERALEMQQHGLESLRDLGRRLDCRLLIGAPRLLVEKLDGEQMGAYGPEAQHNANSAYYMTKDAEILGRYDKTHLVPFGEYVPLRNVLPFLQVLTPMTRDLTPGTELDVFSLPAGDRDVKFGVLICYEDVPATLVRKFTRRGADFLVNITDEGWYRYPGELRQHAAMAVFRAVENRSTVVRAANTGISCFINPVGKIYEAVRRDADGKIRRNVEGAVAAPVKLTDQRTPYVRFGDAFAWLCALLAVVALVAAPVRRLVRGQPENQTEQ
jgi:apolipoprotein N-acyltransferase